MSGSPIRTFSSSKYLNPNHNLLREISLFTFIIITTSIFVQSIHMMEHISQTIQKFVLNYQVAQGIIGSKVDLEPIHFVFNLTYLVLIILTLIYLKPSLKTKDLNFILLITVLILQTWHFIEHSVKLYQHLTINCKSCPGILGNDYNLILLHLFYNSIVFIPLVLVYSIIIRHYHKMIKYS